MGQERTAHEGAVVRPSCPVVVLVGDRQVDRVPEGDSRKETSGYHRFDSGVFDHSHLHSCGRRSTGHSLPLSDVEFVE